MNKSILLFLNACLITFFACKNEPKNTDPNLPANFTPGETADPTVLAGNWIDLDFCARAAQYGSVLQTMNNSHLPYAYAFTFNPGKADSVTCYNANEVWNLPVKYKKDTLELVGAIQGQKPVYLVYHSHGDKDMTMFDNSSGRTRMDNFIKSKAGTPDGYTAFTTALNHHLFSGQFSTVGKGKAADKILFTPGGLIQGMKEYDHYEVCTGGDCFVAGQEIDIITMYHSKQKESSEKMYGYRYSNANDTLFLYNMVNANPEEKGGYKVGTVAYKLARAFSVPVPSNAPQPPVQAKPAGK